MIESLKTKYDFIRKIGQGGMADIYLVKSKDDGKKYAIKVLKNIDRADMAKRKRFEHEMRLLQKIDCEYVVKYYDSEMTNEHAYIIMEYVDGHILKNYIGNRSRLTVDETITLGKQLVFGFDEIHKKGIIHRDIKSQNIMISSGGKIKILDFGIAIDSESARVTKTDMLIGSPQYVSPELIDQEEPSIHSDIYAFGILLYEMVTGKVPFSGKDALDTLKQQQNQKLPRISTVFPNVPVSLENIIIKCTAKKTTQRYNSMHEIYKDLSDCLSLEKQNTSLINLEGKKQRTFISTINSRGFLIGAVAIVGIILLTLLIILLVVLI